ncbi:MAG: spore germination protein [Ruminococcus sp.]|nr:spore germination protein [Ruminococcus sp.]
MKTDDYYFSPIIPDLKRNLDEIKRISGGSSDLLVNEFVSGGIKCALLCCKGMISTSTITELILAPITKIEAKRDSHELFSHIQNNLLLSIDRLRAENYGDLFRTLNSGFAVLIAEEMDTALCFGVQGYAVRGIDEPSGEANIMGAHEGFVEVVRTNMSLIRRRLKSPFLVMKLFVKGDKSQTDVCICYMRDRVPKKLLEEIHASLDRMELESILSTGYVCPFVEGRSFELFSSTGTTEHPDVLCSKLIEGRVALLIDGVPFAIVIPRLFCESFQTLDDYAFKPYYSTFIRWIKYGAFIISVLLPSVYVAVATYHPELLNSTLLMILTEEEANAPFFLITEAFGVLIMYEIIREAGIRLPKPAGGAVSIVSGLIIGDAAVNSGLIGNCRHQQICRSRAEPCHDDTAVRLSCGRMTSRAVRDKSACVRGSCEYMRHGGLRIPPHCPNFAIQGKGHERYGDLCGIPENAVGRLYRGGIS